MTNDKSTTNLVGKQLGDYLITEKLAAGGMAHIYKGVDGKLQRQAAIKVLTPEMMEADDTLTTRFEREARAVAVLDHDNIVPIYQYGEQDGTYFLAMKFVQGMDLADELSRLKRKGEQMDVPRALRILGQVASALDYAHSKGIIHRDVKPSNILLDANDKAILTDFGLVLRQSVDQTLGTAFGTPRYISPEQAIASEDAVSQSDIYSLAVVLFEILTGQPVFKGANPMEMALSHISSAPPSPRSLNEEIPEAAEKEILKALDKDPKKRHPTATEFIDAVKAGYGEDLLKGENSTPKVATSRTAVPVKDSPTPVLTPKLGRPEGRQGSRFVSVLLALMGLIVAVGVLLVVLTNQPPPPPPTAANVAQNDDLSETPVANVAGGNKTPTVKVTTVRPTVTPRTTVIAAAPSTTPISGSPASLTPVPASDTPQPSASPVAVTDVPVAAPTTPAATLTPTMTPTTPAATDVTPGEPPVLTSEALPINLFYNNDVFAILNRSKVAFDTTTLKFIRGDVGGSDTFSGHDITGRSMPADSCVVIFSNKLTKRPPLPKDCDTIRSQFALPEANFFWRADSVHDSFTVQVSGQTVATCPLVKNDVRGDTFQPCAFMPTGALGASG